MQSYHDANGVKHYEFFTGRFERDLHSAMDERRVELEVEGATSFHRTKIGRNTTCPCGSGRKFKKCCIERTKVVPAGRMR